MTTKTDFHAIMELKEKYTPAQHGIVSTTETDLIREVLELLDRGDIELQNVRDMVVMLYAQWADSQRQKDDSPAAMQLMDAMSAITCVIDQEKIKRGLDV